MPGAAGCSGASRCRRRRRVRAGRARWHSGCTSRPSSTAARSPDSTSPRWGRRSGSPCTSSPTRCTFPASRAWARTRCALERDDLAELFAGHSAQLKKALTDQALLSGIGNAYSDEILHVAKLSPFKNTGKLSEDELTRLHEAMRTVLTDAVDRSVGQRAATLKGEKRSGMRVHARAGLPCPICGDTVRSVSFADRHFEYCPTCQTEGRELADRRLSKLLK